MFGIEKMLSLSKITDSRLYRCYKKKNYRKKEEKSTFYCYKLTYYVGTKILNMFHKITKYCTGMTKHIKQWSWRTVRFG